MTAMNQFVMNRLAMTNIAPVPTQEPVPVLEALARQAAIMGANSNPNAEMERIVNLPVRWPLTSEEMEAVNRTCLLANAYNAGFRLNQYQCHSLVEFYDCNGLFGPIGVGWGKTFITLLVAEMAFQRLTDKIMLFVPPEVVIQLTHQQLPLARTLFPVSYPVTLLVGKNRKNRMAFAKGGRRGLFINSYSLLSSPDAEEVLNTINPDLVILDECHRVSQRSAARTRRILRFIEDRKLSGKPVRGVALSGTITGKGIMDYYHLIRWILGDRSPLPLSAAQAMDWAVVIDSDAAPSLSAGPLEPLTSWAKRVFVGQDFPEDRGGFRLAYRARLQSCPGVVSSGDAELGTTLIISNHKVDNHEKAENWKELERLIKQINEQWLTPNGDEIDCAIHTFKWLYELSAGFYNNLVWPKPEVLATHRRLPDQQALELIERAKTHHAYGQEYHRELRRWLLEDSMPGIDTPFLVGMDMFKNGARHVGQKLFDAWRLWKHNDFEGRPERDSIPVRVCPYKINLALDFAKAIKGGGIIWHHHREIGTWLAEELSKAGLPVLHCPAGREYDALIGDVRNHDKIVVASMRAHGTGKNLQHFQNQFFVQWPRDAKLAEQTLGRTHRQGQKADELIAFKCDTIEFDELCFAACLNDALYIHQTTGNRQKLVYSTYDPMPKIFPWEVLRERGMNPQILNHEQRKLFEAHFASAA